MSGEQLGSPAAAILARRASRAALPERLQEQAPYDTARMTNVIRKGENICDILLPL
jgi:hypothetical protein